MMGGRSVDQLLADFGHQLPSKPPKPKNFRDRSLVFTPNQSWRGKRRRGAGWVPSKAPAKQYRMTSDQAGLYWPLMASSPLPPTGAAMGTDMLNDTTFYLDPHGWVLDDSVPVTNPNIFAFGKPGRGKSGWVKAFVNRMLAFWYQTLVLGDIKDEYEPLCRHFGVEPFAIGPGMLTRLNPLDPGPLADGWAQLSPEKREERTDIIFGRWIVLMRSLIGCQTIGDRPVPVGPTEEQILKTVLNQLTFSAHRARELRPITIPEIWHQLNNPSPEVIEATRFVDEREFLSSTRLLRDAVAQLTSGALAGIFDRPTTFQVDWNAPIQSLSLSRLAGLGDQAIGIALTCVNSWGSAMRAVSGRRRINIRDEVWRQLRLGTAAVASFDADLRLSRTHGDIEIAVAHKPSDYLSAGSAGSQAQEIAKDLLHLGDIKILFGQDAHVAGDLENLLDLGPIATHAVSGWAMGAKGRYLACIGPRMYKVALTLHPDLELPLTYTNQNIQAR